MRSGITWRTANPASGRFLGWCSVAKMGLYRGGEALRRFSFGLLDGKGLDLVGSLSTV